ncbi:uncharacterized protein DS421_14g457830 [Arachis hypogaea]|nr:uncharacterized protein DS421_14g457830 [Arachis hypogaea]
MERNIHALHSTVALRENRSLMAHSSTSPSHSKKTQPFHFRATLQTAKIAIVAKIRTLHQHNIELSIKNFEKKRSYNTQCYTVLLSSSRCYCSCCSNSSEKMAARNQAKKNQTKDLKCATHLLSEKFRNMSEEKKTIVRDLGFGGLMHIPPLRVHHQILRELANSFKLGENRLETGYGSFKVRPKIIGAALGINASGYLFPQKVNYKDLFEDDKEIFRRFQGKILKNLTDEMMDIGVGNEQDRLMFKRIFILYIQMAFLLPTKINKISPVHMAPILEMDTIIERNWGGHVLSFIIKGIADYKLKKKKAIDGCLFALMIIYFHLSKNKDKKRAERPLEPWIANWSKEQLVERMRAKIEENMSETQEDSENSPRKQPSKKAKKMESKKRKKNQEDSDSESESTYETQSKKKKVIVEDSSPEQAQSYHGYNTLEKEADLRSTEGHYVSSEIIPDVNLGSDDPSSQGHRTKLSLVEESASEPADSNMMVVREETPSEGLAINPAPEDAAALMMMARTVSYVPKTDPMPSFSLGFTDSSQEETTTQEGASTQDEHRAKTPETPKLLEQLEDLIPKESGAESFEKFETPVRTNENSSDMKEKCYLWAIRVKTYADGLTDEFDNVCRLQAQDIYTLLKLHLASLAPKTHIEAEIVSAMCFILNQQNIQRFQEEVYCLPPDIVNMALANHPQGVFLQLKNNKPFRVEDYPIYLHMFAIHNIGGYGSLIQHYKNMAD